MASSSSSQFGILLVASIGMMMVMMAPHSGSALECYDERFKMSSRGQDAALDLGNLLQVGATAPHLLPFGMPTNGNGNHTMQCSADTKHCITARCPKLSMQVLRGCEVVPEDSTPEQQCENYRRTLCGDKDGKFYCRMCQTDKCNNEPIDD